MNKDIFLEQTDSICAIATPAGSGGIAVARLSGKDALQIADKVWKGQQLSLANSHTAHLGYIYNPADGQVLDQAVATIFIGPNSFTGENTVEFSVHGSRWIQERLIQLLIDNGARMALPGEFTQRAFRNGKLDLAEAEAVADLIAASSRAAHRIAISQMRGEYSRNIQQLHDTLLKLASLLELELDFSEEDVEFASRQELLSISQSTAQTLRRLAAGFKSGSAIKNGIPVALIGRTNVGKSSILNAILRDDKAIVSDIHGTTRDIVEDTAEIGDYLVRFRDTAGLRSTEDPIEQLGIERSRKAAIEAELTVYVIDNNAPAPFEEIKQELYKIEPEKILFIINKADLDAYDQSLPSTLAEAFPEAVIKSISAKNDSDIDILRTTISDCLARLISETEGDAILVTNARHASAMASAADNLEALAQGIEAGIPGDLLAQDLREALHHLSSITGQITTPQILQSIFSSFCIGK